MIAKRLVQALPIRSDLGQLIVGSMFVALSISLGTVAIAGAVDITLPAAVPAGMAAAGAAVFAASLRKK